MIMWVVTASMVHARDDVRERVGLRGLQGSWVETVM